MTKVARFTEADLIEYKQKQRKRKANKSVSTGTNAKKVTKIPTISCHAKALIRLQKFPALKEGGTMRGKRVQANHEHWDQVTVFDYFERNNADVYEHLSAIPNGGLRNKKTANELLEEGVKSGYPDMTLDIPRGIYHGMKIELKHENGGGPSDNQISWLNRHHKQGYFACLVYGYEQAIAVIEQYYNLQAGEKMPVLETESKWLNK